MARIGIAALNIVTPGFGLLRLARLRPTLRCWFAILAGSLLLLLFWTAAPILSFSLLAGSVAVWGLLVIGTMLVSIASSWRQSRVRMEGPIPVWSRWYSLIAVYLASILISALFVGALHRSYKPFYLPSEAMAPTLLTNERIVASMRKPEFLARGDVILFPVGDRMYIKRIAGLPGDTIGLRGGAVILNGRRVQQILLRTERFHTSFGDRDEQRLREQFPGEHGWHQIYDSGQTELDDFAETRVLPGHLFVLGDNRDMSADSRVSRAWQGVEQLAIDDVRGKALFYTWGPSDRTGQRITPLNLR